MGAEATRSDERLRRGQTALAALAALLAGGGALAGALATGPDTSGLSGGVETLSAVSGTLLGELATALPLGYAFSAGMVAAVNPCGFALLPAYLALYVGAGEAEGRQRGIAARALQALSVGVTMTAGFIALFGAAGLILSVATVTLARYLPWVGLAIGVLLVLVGGRMLGGGSLSSSLAERLAERVGARARDPGGRGYLAYGLAYGLASLSCTLPIFLTVVASTVTVDGFLAAAAQFVLYGLGMGSVIVVLTLAVAFLSSAAVSRVQMIVRYVQPTSALLLLLAGAYIIYYWLTLGGLLLLISQAAISLMR